MSERDPDGASRVDVLRGVAAPTRPVITGTTRVPLLITNRRELASRWSR